MGAYILDQAYNDQKNEAAPNSILFLPLLKSLKNVQKWSWPEPLALAAKITLKWTKYGPKWPKMATKGTPSTVWLYPGLMYLIWGPFTQFWDTETAKIASELAHFLYFNFQPSGGWGPHLVSLKFTFFCIFGPYRVP